MRWGPVLATGTSSWRMLFITIVSMAGCPADTPPPRTLTVQVDVIGEGEVAVGLSGYPRVMECDEPTEDAYYIPHRTCTTTYSSYDVLGGHILNFNAAETEEYWSFSSWGEDCYESGDDPQATVDVTPIAEDDPTATDILVHCTATFAVAPAALHLTVNGGEYGVVRSALFGGFECCDGTLGADYYSDSSEAGWLDAIPRDESVFLGWSDDCTDADPTCYIEVPVNREKFVTATFGDAVDEGCGPVVTLSEGWTDRRLYAPERDNLAVASDAVSEAFAAFTTDIQCAATGFMDFFSPFRSVPADCSDPGVTCAPGAGPLTGQVAAVAIQVASDVPVNDPTFAFQYGFVFETDGDPANDWTPISAYPNDTFKGTDTWVQYTAPKNGPWSVGVDDITTSDAIVRRPTSNARVIRDGTTLTMLIPLNELGAAPLLRTTAFRHDGAWLNGQWNIDYYPNTTSPLLPLIPAQP